MKTRVGFVSNSSSTSFCIFGAQVSDKEIAEKLLHIDMTPQEVPNCKHDIDRDKFNYCPICGKEVYTTVEKKLPAGLEKACASEGLNMMYIGESEDADEGTYVGIDLKENYNNVEEVLEVLKNACVKIEKLFDKKCKFITGTYAS